MPYGAAGGADVIGVVGRSSLVRHASATGTEDGGYHEVPTGGAGSHSVLDRSGLIQCI
jgi:hypothetical protein